MTKKTRRRSAVLLAVLLIFLAIASAAIPTRHIVLHNVLHHLNIVPFMLAGLIFGWRGAVRALLAAMLLQAPSIYHHWSWDPIDAQDQLVELGIFGFSGAVAGLLADRERLQRTRVETTKAELEQVYTELRENIEQLKRAERLSVAGQLSASLAHEIRNPLASITGAAGILARGNATEANRTECLQILTQECTRLNRLLTGFLDFARPRAPRWQQIEPAALVRSVAGLAQHAASEGHITIRQKVEDDLPEITCDPEQMKQVLLNLLLNAIQSFEGSGKITVRCARGAHDVLFEVRDNGRGIQPKIREKIFDPFFTTKERGSGLGLAVAANLVAQHEGSLTCIQNEDGPGTTFRLTLPVRARDGAVGRAPGQEKVVHL